MIFSRKLQIASVVSVACFLGVANPLHAQTCTQTLSVGANVASAVSTAPNGSTICLNNGNYGTVNFTNIVRSDYVTVRSTSGVGATIKPQIGNSKFIKFQSLTIAGSLINSCASNIQILKSTFTSGLLVNMRGVSCSNLNLLIDGNSFGDLGPATYEGRLSVADDDGPQASMGLTISNNTFGPGCQSDGVQLVGGSSGVALGPGNIFDGINQSGSVHCDMIQFYGDGQNNTIIGNWFKNGSVVLTHHTSAPRNTVFRNNLITNVRQFQVGQSANFVFEHNTVYNLTDVFTINSNSTSAMVQNNVFIGNTSAPTFSDLGFGACVSCTLRYSLCDDAGSCKGTNQLIAVPTFVGGSVPSTWSGWQMAAGSAGANAANDGQNLGTNYYGGSAQPVAPTAPTNLRVTP